MISSTGLWYVHGSDLYLKITDFPEPVKKKLKQEKEAVTADLEYTNLWPEKTSCTPASSNNFIKNNHQYSPYGETSADSKGKLYTQYRIREEPIQPGRTHTRQQQNTSSASAQPPERPTASLNTLTEINSVPDSYTTPLWEGPASELGEDTEQSRPFEEFCSYHPMEELFEYQPPVPESCSDKEALSCDNCLPPASSTNDLKSTDKEKERFSDQYPSSEQLSPPQIRPLISQNHNHVTATPLKNQKRLSEKTPSDRVNKEIERELYDKIKSILFNINNTCMTLLKLSPRQISSNIILLMAIEHLASVEKKDTVKKSGTTGAHCKKATTSINQPKPKKQHTSLQANQKIDHTGQRRKNHRNKINILKEQLNLPETTSIAETLKSTAEALINNQQGLSNKPLYFSDIVNRY